MSKTIKTTKSIQVENFTFSSEYWNFLIQEDGYIKITLKRNDSFSPADIPSLQLQIGAPCTYWFPENKVRIEYEKAELLKRPDGSVISGLKDGQKVITIKQNKNGKYEITGYGYDNHDLLNGFVFLPKDLELAEKKAAMLTKQLEIQHEIDKLNAESRKTDFNFSLYHDVSLDLVKAVFATDNFGCQNSTHSTVETILAKYSQDELKQYLGIII